MFSTLSLRRFDAARARTLLQYVMVLVGAICTAPASAEDDYLSIKYSQKNQVRTSLVWIQHKADLIVNVRKPADGKRRVNIEGARAVGQSLIDKNPIYGRTGKLFFKDPEGEIRSCSASFAGGDSIITTAAHCVMTADGDWNRDFIFIRAYGSANQEIHAVRCIAIPGIWGEFVEDTTSFDYAFIRTVKPSKVGSFKVSAEPPPESLQLVGYADKFVKGRAMLTMNFMVDDQAADRLGSRNNELGHGNSGSPWINRFSQQLHSVSSYYDRSNPRDLWGPRLTEASIELLAYTEDGC